MSSRGRAYSSGHRRIGNCWREQLRTPPRAHAPHRTHCKCVPSKLGCCDRSGNARAHAQSRPVTAAHAQSRPITAPHNQRIVPCYCWFYHSILSRLELPMWVQETTNGVRLTSAAVLSICPHSNSGAQIGRRSGPMRSLLGLLGRRPAAVDLPQRPTALERQPARNLGAPPRTQLEANSLCPRSAISRVARA